MKHTPNTVLYARGLTAAISHRLESAGRTDVVVRREWFVDDVPHELLLMNVPISPDLVVPLRLGGGAPDPSGEGWLDRTAENLANALVNLSAGAKALGRYVAAVREQALVHVGEAQRAGLDVGIERVGLKPTYAHHLARADWRDAVPHVLATVTIRCTSLHLQPETTEVVVGDPSDVAEALADTFAEQRERQERILELEDLGGDLIVDGITLDLLRAHGIEAVDALRRVWKEQRVPFAVQYDGAEVDLALRSSEGRVTASILLPEARWTGEHLWFRGDEQRNDHASLAGRTLAGLVAHPVFATRPIVEVIHQDVDLVFFDLSDEYIFDACMKTLRPLGRRLAA